MLVVTRSKRGTTTKQYRYRGGPKSLYIRESHLAQGTKYVVDYRRNRIVRSPRIIETLVKTVRQRRGKGKARGPSRPIVKTVRSAPSPISARKILPLMPGKIYYEKRHNITEFLTPMQENKFLLNILSKATKKKKDALILLKDFNKVKGKMSYSVEIHGIDSAGKQALIGNFVVVGKKPSEIKEMLRKADLLPQHQRIDLQYGAETQKRSLGQSGVPPAAIRFNQGSYEVTDVHLQVKFYNNPQQTLT